MCLRPIFYSFEIIDCTKLLFDYICACGLDFRVLKLLVLHSFYLILHVPAAYILDFWNYCPMTLCEFEIIGSTKLSFDYICVCGLDFGVLKLLFYKALT